MKDFEERLIKAYEDGKKDAFDAVLEKLRDAPAFVRAVDARKWLESLRDKIIGDGGGGVSKETKKAREKELTPLEYSIEVLLIGNYDARTLNSVGVSMRDADDELAALRQENECLKTDIDDLKLQLKCTRSVVTEAERKLKVAVEAIEKAVGSVQVEFRTTKTYLRAALEAIRADDSKSLKEIGENNFTPTPKDP